MTSPTEIRTTVRGLHPGDLINGFNGEIVQRVDAVDPLSWRDGRGAKPGDNALIVFESGRLYATSYNTKVTVHRA